MIRLFSLTLLLAGCATLPQPPPRTLVYNCSGTGQVVARETGKQLWLFLPVGARDLQRQQSKTGRLYTGSTAEFWIHKDSAQLKLEGRGAGECQPDPAAAIWEEARFRGVDFRAAGNEPGWVIERSGDQLIYAGNYGRELLNFSGVKPVRDDRLVQTTIESQTAGHHLEILLQYGDCRDRMSGELLSIRVTLRLDGKTYYGCGKNLN